MNTFSYILRDLAVFAVAYLVGSVPFSYIFAKMIKGVDITKVGSRNMGATNVLRTAGPLPAAFAFAGDFLKAVLLLLVLIRFFPAISRETLLVAAVVVVLGHDFSVLAGFKGGKGVATTFGVVFVLSWPVALVESGIWLVVMVLRNTVSLASVAVFATLPVAALLLRQPPKLVLIYTLLAVLGIVRHVANIRRLRAGEEPKLEWSYFRRR
ncbi:MULTISPECIES: glycerol-3-phosphate 1-O-acyltransferase PlsY [Candidatus Cryosericum]|jgi:glycerol-3-phosphate acyltransferase PlsY|uniref:Glycerol-3-phosphate acyltransferase n=2 Tax=Candidatus Cryosericum TaxID=2498709 RepID=A0A398DXM3_9BACT|nr:MULTISPECIES: glycerol-3-phosphate 1-O-acyltransferase PlsY [Cryosericum]RIE09466.1 glycerol-3-phosphate 1-O-acyltransferase [Candidatus Cryosericum hinesii]RIE10927.1 glycerol-3-phosphate 1-O-acyltransferase [Candidatus Cryosericum odellii]RIE13343.1 glycerol-3-phosphate 1-O-acyltransferase [Candidatus Cryosericum hinesii]RIE15131.1 glycerol-3-phosphate 1-O-acyltransferase [Candidatus Cryosericum hinesii]